MRQKVQWIKVGTEVRIAGNTYRVRGLRRLVCQDGSYALLNVSSLTEYKAFKIPWDYKIRCKSQHLSAMGGSITGNARSGA